MGIQPLVIDFESMKPTLMWVGGIVGTVVVGGSFIMVYKAKRKMAKIEAMIESKKKKVVKKIEHKPSKMQEQAGYNGFFSFLIPKGFRGVSPKTQIIYKNRYISSELTEIKDFDKKKFYYEAEPRDYFKSRSFLRRYLDNKLRRKQPEKIVLIRMELNNGQYKEFLTAEEKEGFIYKGGKYIFDLDARYFVIDSNMWAYDFHESLAFPVKRRIPLNKIKSTLEHSKITEIENAINPVTLERFIKSEIAQGILQGAAIGKLFKVMLIMLIIALILIGLDFIIDLFSSGLLEELMPKK